MMKDPVSRRLVLALLALWLAIGVTDVLAFLLPGVLGPTPGPIAVLIVEETEDRNDLTPGQRAVIQSNAPGSVRDYCKTHCEKDAAGVVQFRVLDKDDSLDKDTDEMKALFALKRDSVPWLVIKRSGMAGVAASEPLPKTAEETLSLLKRYGGP